MAAQEAQPPTEQPPLPPPEEQPPPPPKKGAPLTVLYDGGTIFRGEKFELRLNGQFQTRWELTRVKIEGEGDTSQRFIMPRTRIGMQGWIFSKAITYKFEGALTDNGLARLRDFYVNVELAGPMLQLRAGQWKRPFNRQEIVSDFATELPEKALTNGFLEGGRDVGIGFTNGYDKSPDGVEYAVGLFNGTGDAARQTVTCNTAMPPVCTVTAPSVAPTDWQPMLVARVGVNVGGIKGYSEADLEGGPLRLAAGAGYKLKNIQNDAGRPLTHTVEVDAVAKIEGFDIQVLGFFQKVKDTDSQFGGHVQAGYFITPKGFQVCGRFGAVPLPKTMTVPDQEYNLEYRGGLNYYFYGHALKVSSDFGATKDTTDGASAVIQARVQGQLIF